MNCQLGDFISYLIIDLDSGCLDSLVKDFSPFERERGPRQELKIANAVARSYMVSGM